MADIIKARFWWFVLYPESAPADWIERIQMTGLPFCFSPLHEFDVNPTGELKKPHYHVIVAYNGPTTYNNVKKTLTDPLCCPHPQFLSSVKGAYRYLVHLDNPEKYQYNQSDITCVNGFSSDDYFDLSSSEEDRLYSAIEDIIIENHLTEFFHVVVFLKTHGQLELLSFYRRHAIYFKEFICSCRYSSYCDPESGEIKFSSPFPSIESN